MPFSRIAQSFNLVLTHQPKSPRTLSAPPSPSWAPWTVATGERPSLPPPRRYPTRSHPPNPPFPPKTTCRAVESATRLVVGCASQGPSVGHGRASRYQPVAGAPTAVVPTWHEGLNFRRESGTGGMGFRNAVSDILCNSYSLHCYLYGSATLFLRHVNCRTFQH